MLMMGSANRHFPFFVIERRLFMNGPITILDHKLGLFIPDKDSKGALLHLNGLVPSLAKSMARSFGGVRNGSSEPAD